MQLQCSGGDQELKNKIFEKRKSVTSSNQFHEQHLSMSSTSSSSTSLKVFKPSASFGRKNHTGKKRFGTAKKSKRKALTNQDKENGGLHLESSALSTGKSQSISPMTGGDDVVLSVVSPPVSHAPVARNHLPAASSAVASPSEIADAVAAVANAALRGDKVMGSEKRPVSGEELRKACPRVKILRCALRAVASYAREQSGYANKRREQQSGAVVS